MAASRMEGGASVRLEGLARRFGPTAGVEGVSVEVAAGSCAAFVGASGCGKSTLLRVICGLERSDAGAVHMESGVTVSMCFQEPRLLPWRDALGNVELPLELAGVPRRERRRRALDVLAMVELVGAEEVLPAALSGGMRMRVGLARALVTRPSVLLLDEPCGALDEVTRMGIDLSLVRLRRQLGTTMLLVTHSIDEATAVADTVHVMKGRPGRLGDTIEVPEGAGLGEQWNEAAASAVWTRIRRALHEAAGGVA